VRCVRFLRAGEEVCADRAAPHGRRRAAEVLRIRPDLRVVVENWDLPLQRGEECLQRLRTVEVDVRWLQVLARV
jgi:hypothetical protein